MRRQLFRLIVIAALITATFSLVSLTAAAGKPADIRVFHALHGVEQADFYLNDIYAGSLGYSESAPYILVQPGKVTLKAFAPGMGPDGTALFEGTFDAGDDQRMNVALIGSGTEMKLGVFATDLSPVPAGQARVHVICSSTGWPEYKLSAIGADKAEMVLADKLAPGATVTVNVPVGSYTLKGNGLSEKFSTMSFNAGTVYSIFVVDYPNASGSGKTAELRTFSGGATIDGPMGYLRLVHAIPDAPAVDAYVNNALVAPGLKFGDFTVHMAVPPGKYDVSLFAAGSDPKQGKPLSTLSADVADGAALTGIAMGSLNTPTLAALTDDRTAPPDTQSRIAIYNARPDAIDVSLDGASVAKGLGAGQLSSLLDVPSGKHAISVTAGGAEIAAWKDYSVSPNTAFVLRTLIITGKAPIVLSARPAQK